MTRNAGRGILYQTVSRRFCANSVFPHGNPHDKREGKMDTLEEMLETAYGDQYKAEAGDFIKENIFMWLLNAENGDGREFNNKNLGSAIKSALGDVSTRSFCMGLTYSEHAGYILGSLKPWMWWSIKHGFGQERTEDAARAFGILDKDVEMAEFAEGPLAAACSSMIRKYEAFGNTEMRDKLETALASLQEERYVEKFCRRKLSFVANGGGKWTHQDLTSELIYYATRDVLTQYPRIESDLHFLNIMKRSIHNRGMNIITSATSESSQGLRAVGDYNDGTFEARTLSFDDNAMKQEVLCEDGEWESSTLAVARRTKGRKKRKALRLLAGCQDDGFSAYLGMDNEKFYDEHMLASNSRRKRNSFLNALAGYVEMDRSKLDKLMEDTAKVLAR